MLAALWALGTAKSALARLTGNPWILLGLGIAGLCLYGARETRRANEAAQHAARLQSALSGLQDAIQAANRQALASKASYEARQELVTSDVQNDLRGKLDDALGRLRDAEANSGHAFVDSLPPHAQPAPVPAGASAPAVVDDGRACTEAVVKAEGWQEWYNRAAEVKMAPDSPTGN
jgi:hypothetical protein